MTLLMYMAITLPILIISYFLVGCYVYRKEFTNDWFIKSFNDAVSQGVHRDDAFHVVCFYANIQRYKWPIKLLKDYRSKKK